MAAIDKVCEYSGEYPGGLMHRYKINRIQVIPKYRELFKNQPHVLFIVKERDEESQDPWRKLWTDNYDQDQNVYKLYDKHRRWYENKNYYMDGSSEWFKTRAGDLKYCLYVPTLQGRVSGMYWNGTMNPSRAIRNIRKMLKTDKLNIVRFSKKDDMSLDWIQDSFNKFYPNFDFSSIEIQPEKSYTEQLEELIAIASRV